MISLAGRALRFQDAKIADRLERFHRPDEFVDFDWQQWSHSLGHLPPPVTPMLPPVRIGQFTWPATDAARFAVGYYLATNDDLDAIRAEDAITDEGPQPINLVIDDGETSLTVEVYLLPPRPLAKITGHTSLWLLTVVDIRYFWWYRSAAITASGDWNALFSSIATALGATIAADTIDADYQSPSDRFTVHRQPLPQLLDAACRMCGSRFVAKLDGTFAIQSYATAKTAQDLELAKIPDEYIPLAGGERDEEDMARFVPEHFRVFFSQTIDGEYQNEPYEVTPAFSVSPGDPFETVTGFDGTKVFIADLTAEFDTGGGGYPDPENLADLQAYADILCDDWFHWHLGDMDEVFRGVVPWVCNGNVGTLVFTQDIFNVGIGVGTVDIAKLTTRVMRPNSQDLNLGQIRLSALTGAASKYPEGADDAAGLCHKLTESTFKVKIVTNVCAVVDEETGFLTGIIPERREFTFPECVVSVGTKDCTPVDDCCGSPPACECCGGPELCLTLSADGGGEQLRIYNCGDEFGTSYGGMPSITLMQVDACTWEGSLIFGGVDYVLAGCGGPTYHLDFQFSFDEFCAPSLSTRCWQTTPYPYGATNCGIDSFTCDPSLEYIATFACTDINDPIPYGEDPFRFRGQTVIDGACA